MRAKLVIVQGGQPRHIDLKLPVTIGRGRNVGLTVPHPLVSRKHCEIYENQGVLVVRDLDSLNGTFLGSEQVEGESVLLPGGLLTVGNITFRAEYELDRPLPHAKPAKPPGNGGIKISIPGASPSAARPAAIPRIQIGSPPAPIMQASPPSPVVKDSTPEVLFRVDEVREINDDDIEEIEDFQSIEESSEAIPLAEAAEIVEAETEADESSGSAVLESLEGIEILDDSPTPPPPHVPSIRVRKPS